MENVLDALIKRLELIKNTSPINHGVLKIIKNKFCR